MSIHPFRRSTGQGNQEQCEHKGISINNSGIKLNQYANDTTLILDASKEALSSALNMLDEFRKDSGLKFNVFLKEVLEIWQKSNKFSGAVSRTKLMTQLFN